MDKIFNDMVRSLNEKINSLKSASKELDKKKYLDLVDIVKDCIYNGMVSHLDVDSFLSLRDANIVRILDIINLNDEIYDDFISNIDKYRNVLNNSHNKKLLDETYAKVQVIVDNIKMFADKFDKIEQNEIKSFGSQIEKCENIIEIIEGRRPAIISKTEFDMYWNFLKNNGFSVREQFKFVKKCGELNSIIALENNVSINYEYSINKLVKEYLANDEYRLAAQEYIENNTVDIYNIDAIAEEIAIQRKLDKPIIKNTLIAIIAHDLFLKSVRGENVSIEDIKVVLDGEEIIKVDHLRTAKEVLRNFDLDKSIIENVNAEDRTTLDLITNDNLTYTQAHDLRYVPLIVKLEELLRDVESLDKTSDTYEEDYSTYVELISDIVNTVSPQQKRM